MSEITPGNMTLLALANIVLMAGLAVSVVWQPNYVVAACSVLTAALTGYHLGRFLEREKQRTSTRSTGVEGGKSAKGQPERSLSVSEVVKKARELNAADAIDKAVERVREEQRAKFEREANRQNKPYLAASLGLEPSEHLKRDLVARWVDWQMQEWEQNEQEEPDMETSTEMSLCGECNAFLDDSRDQRKHRGRVIDRCLTCAKHGLCPSVLDGIHTVVWPEDPVYDASRITVGPLPEGLRVGYCNMCRQEFVAKDDGTFRDLTWEMVGVLWAEHQWTPDDMEVPDLHVLTVASAGWSPLMDRASIVLRGYHEPITVPIPDEFTPHDPVMRLMQALGIPEGEVDIDALVGRKVRAELNSTGQVVAFFPLPKEDE